MTGQNADIVREAGHKKHPQFWLDRHQMLRQLSTTHSRHHHIGQQQVQPIQLLRRKQARLQTLLRLNHPVSKLSQSVPEQNAHAGVVFDQQNGLVPSNRLSGHLGDDARCASAETLGKKMSNLVPWLTRLVTSMAPPDWVTIP